MQNDQLNSVAAKIVASHKSQIPNGEVKLQVVDPAGQFERATWFGRPDAANRFKQDGLLAAAWTAPDIPQVFQIEALVRAGAPDDLTKISGIDQEYADLLANGGIDVYAAFALVSDEDMQAVLGQNTTSTDFDSWRKAAAKLAIAQPDKQVIRIETDIEVTPNALPLAVVQTIQQGGEALERSAEALAQTADGGIRLRRQYAPASPQKALWALIDNRTEAISFPRYEAFIDRVMCGDASDIESAGLRARIGQLRFRGNDAYDALREATEAFLMLEAGVLPADVVFDEKEERRRLPQMAVEGSMAQNRDEYLVALEKESQIKTLPYFKVIREQLKAIPLKTAGQVDGNCYGILRSRITRPVLIELIWSYWIEEALCAQIMKVLSLRFQNRAVKGAGGRTSPLTGMTLDPLRPMSNLLWGYVDNESRRLSVVRRAYEYDHHYGFTISGDAVPKLEAADSRKGFLEAFHLLVHRCSIFFRDQTDTTKVPSGYPLLTQLKECHLLLAAGADNQYGELPSVSRAELLLEQWLLARPEMRDFLGRRAMVPYPETWMSSVDQARELMGWGGGISVRPFAELAKFAEKIFLSIRFGNWSNEFNEDVAALWAQQVREAVLAYINAYRTVTGVDLSADGDAASTELSKRRVTPPSELLRARISAATAAE